MRGNDQAKASRGRGGGSERGADDNDHGGNK